jgi:hypothetical protein
VSQRELYESVGRNIESLARKFVRNYWTRVGGNQHRVPGTILRQMRLNSWWKEEGHNVSQISFEPFCFQNNKNEACGLEGFLPT